MMTQFVCQHYADYNRNLNHTYISTNKTLNNRTFKNICRGSSLSDSCPRFQLLYGALVSYGAFILYGALVRAIAIKTLNGESCVKSARRNS